jgi:hypothetical protein
MYSRRWTRASVGALLVCAAVIAGGQALDSVGEITVQARALTAALAVKPEGVSPAAVVVGERDSTPHVVLAALATLQIAGIVAFEAWVFSRRRKHPADTPH